MSEFKTVSSISEVEKSAFPSLWTFPAPPLMADVEEFEKLKRTAMFSVGDIGDEASEFMDEVVKSLLEKKYRYRHNGKDADELSVKIVTSLPAGSNEIYKPFKDFGTMGVGKLEHTQSTFDAHSISASTFNLYAELKKISPKSNKARITQEVNEDSSIPYSDKGMEISRRTTIEDGDRAKFASFDGLKPFIRSYKASDTHVIFGPDCNVPVSFLMIHTTDGCTSVDNMKDDKTNYLSYQLMQCKLYNIPLFNVATSAGRDGVRKFLADN